MTAEKIEQIKEMHKSGKSIATISKELLITRSSVYYVVDPLKKEQAKSFNPYSPGFSIYLVYLLDILIRSISSKLFDT